MRFPRDVEGSADRFCNAVELRAELEPAPFQRLDLLVDGLEALAGFGAGGDVELRLGEACLERVALGEHDAELVVDAVELLAQRPGRFGALLAGLRLGLAVLARPGRRRGRLGCRRLGGGAPGRLGFGARWPVVLRAR